MALGNRRLIRFYTLTASFCARLRPRNLETALLFLRFRSLPDAKICSSSQKPHEISGSLDKRPHFAAGAEKNDAAPRCFRFCSLRPGKAYRPSLLTTVESVPAVAAYDRGKRTGRRRLRPWKAYRPSAPWRRAAEQTYAGYRHMKKHV